MTGTPEAQGQPAVPPTPVGMYPDPERPGQMRYWDGSAWAASGTGMPGLASKPLWKRGWFIGAMAFLTLGVIGVATGASNTDQDAKTLALSTVAVPDLVGQPASAVVPALGAVGLNLGPTTYGPSDLPVDQVVSQNPAPGTAVEAGTPVSVVLSSGPPSAPAPVVTSDPPAPEPVEPAPVPAAAEPAPAPEPVEPELTAGQQNAVEKAESYLEFTAFSKKGLIKQLQFEGFSKTDATFAVNNISVNWNEQAAKKAESYLEFTSFSRAGLIKQLEFEGFTTAQAKYGASQVGL